MEKNKTQQQNSHTVVVKKPDVKAGLMIQCHVKISDPRSGEILLKTRG